MSLKNLLTDLRVGLTALLAVQGFLVDTLTNAGVPTKAVSAGVAIVAALATALQVKSETSAPSVLPTPKA